MFSKIFKRISDELKESVNEKNTQREWRSFGTIEVKLQELLNSLPLKNPLHDIPKEYTMNEYYNKYTAFFLSTPTYILKNIPEHMIVIENYWSSKDKDVTFVEINKELYDDMFPLKNSKKNILGRLITTLKSIPDDVKDKFYETHYESIMNVIELVSKLGNEEDLELEKLLTEWINELIDFARVLNKEFSKETLRKIKMELEFAKLQNQKLVTEI